VTVLLGHLTAALAALAVEVPLEVDDADALEALLEPAADALVVALADEAPEAPAAAAFEDEDELDPQPAMARASPASRAAIATTFLMRSTPVEVGMPGE